MKILLLLKGCLIWTMAVVALAAVGLYMVFRCLALQERPDLTQSQLARRLEHFAGNLPVWRLPSGYPSDYYICSTNLDFTTNTFILNTEELAQWVVDQRGHLFSRMIAAEKRGSGIEAALRSLRASEP